MTTDHELDEVLRIARTAERHVRAIYGTAFTVELKAPGDPVTRADREASDMICAALAASFPGDAVLSEESVPAGPGQVARLRRRRRASGSSTRSTGPASSPSASASSR